MFDGRSGDDAVETIERIGLLLTMIKILCARMNPYAFGASLVNVYDNDTSPGDKGSLRQVTFDPERKLFWIAALKILSCASLLDEMLGLPDGERCPTPAID